MDADRQEPVAHDWYDSEGTVAQRTNEVINGLVIWARKQDNDRVTRANVRDAVEQLTPVGTQKTVTEYVERVVRYGPFKQRGDGVWAIEWRRVDRVTGDEGERESDVPGSRDLPSVEEVRAAEEGEGDG